MQNLCTSDRTQKPIELPKIPRPADNRHNIGCCDFSGVDRLSDVAVVGGDRVLFDRLCRF